MATLTNRPKSILGNYGVARYGVSKYGIGDVSGGLLTNRAKS